MAYDIYLGIYDPRSSPKPQPSKVYVGSGAPPLRSAACMHAYACVHIPTCVHAYLHVCIQVGSGTTSEVGCTASVTTFDLMGNQCIEGGATLTAELISKDKRLAGRSEATQLSKQEATSPAVKVTINQGTHGRPPSPRTSHTTFNPHL